MDPSAAPPSGAPPTGPPPDASGMTPMLPNLTPEQIAALPHDNYGPHLLGAIWTLWAVASVFLILRVYCKWFRHRGLWWDDWVLIAAWVCSETGCVMKCVD